MNIVPLFQQQLCKISTVLPGYTRYQSALVQSFYSFFPSIVEACFGFLKTTHNTAQAHSPVRFERTSLGH